MLALAAAPLGIDCRFIDPAADAGAGVAAEQIAAPYDDAAALTDLADWADVITFEFENVPAGALDAIDGRVRLAPSPRSLEVSQDRVCEKELFASLGLPAAESRPVASLEDLDAALGEIGVPAMLKTRRLGYDGKGQVRIDSVEGAATAWELIGRVPAILERLVAFEREVSAVVVRAADGASIAYPAAENIHRDGILHTSTAPAGGDAAVATEAVHHALAVAGELQHVGALALELFDTGDGLVCNEIAPRVHNSGHWTLDGCGVSQFENHVRAVCGLPLGDPDPALRTVMINLVGQVPSPEELLAVGGTHLHLYDKQPRAGRKLGHVNVVELAGGDSTLDARASAVIDLADAAWC